jgi:2-methylcitrate synthase
MVAADYRFKKGLDFITPRNDLSIAENFFHMCFEKVPSADVVKCFDVSLILYAEHSFNASTFASRVITSTQSDIYSATVGGIGALKGPLHGGANEQVMHMMLEVADPAKAEQWMLDALAQKRKVMGFGHRVYKSGDSRVPTMKKYAQKMADITGQQKWMQIYNSLEKVMVEKKKIYPNLDFPAGPAYHMMGFEIDFFTPIFVMARTTGWSAHILEQTANNRIIRPLSEYIGAPQRQVIPISERK